jgi:hypothetical protein
MSVAWDEPDAAGGQKDHESVLPWHALCKLNAATALRQILPEIKQEDAMTVTAAGTQPFDVYSKYNSWVEKYPGRSADANGASGSASASSGISGMLSGEGRQELQKALEAMKQEGYTSFSFADIEDYRQKLEKDFSSAVREDLKTMGVDPDIEFQLVLDASGNAAVVSDHPDKAAVEQYLKDNPEMVGVFKHIQALSNLKKAQQRASARNSEFTRDVKRSLQAEALQAFFEASDNNGQDYFSQIATFGSKDATSFLLGLNAKA